MTKFNERTNIVLYKNIISHNLFSKGVMFLLCVRGELETRIDCYILIIAALLSHPGWAAKPWVTEGPRSLSGAGFPSAGILSQTQTQTGYPKPSVAIGYIIVWHPPASCGRTNLPNSTTFTGQGDIPLSSTWCISFAVLPFIYTGASLDWRLSRGSICNTGGFGNKRKSGDHQNYC